MKAPLSPYAPTSDSLQSLPKKRHTYLLEPYLSATREDVENPETGSSSSQYPSAADIERLFALDDIVLAGTGFDTMYTYDTLGFEEDNALHQRVSRANSARVFRSAYRYGSSPADTEIYEEKYCIWSSHTCSWKDKSSGIMWVAVHGIDSICVVTSVIGVDMTRLADDWKRTTENEIVCLFLETVISDIEDIADPSSKLRERLVHLSIEKPPFGVVSVIPLTNEVDGESNQDEVDEDYCLEDTEYCAPNKTMEFLEKKMKNGDSTSTTSKTIETAIGALQQLFNAQLEACEIQGCFLNFKETKIKFLQISDLERHLAVINAEASIN